MSSFCFLNSSANIFVLSCFVALQMGCTKQDAEHPLEPNTNHTKSTDEAPFLFKNSDASGYTGFSVFDAGRCSYGSTESNYLVGSIDGSGRLVAFGNCKLDPNHLLLARGSSGNLGPVYYIHSQNALNFTNNTLKLQVRNVSGSIPSNYNGRFYFDAVTNTWTIPPSSSPYFSCSVVNVSDFRICEKKN